MEQFRLMAAANGQGGGGAPFKPKTLSGVPYDECISGIQKMIRRGKEREALILARELCASGYPAAVARRLMIIACEDIGLASRRWSPRCTRSAWATWCSRKMPGRAWTPSR